MHVLAYESETKNMPQDQQLAIAYDYCRHKGDFVNDFVEVLLDGVVNDFVKDDLEIKDILREMQQGPSITGAPLGLTDTTTGGILQGIATFTNRPMTPVVSSTVKGKGVFGKDLLVQFHDRSGTYRYHFETPELAVQAFDEMSQGSPGRWIWNKMRGHRAGEAITPDKIGPAYFSGKPTIGGTTASQKPYDIAGRTPQVRLPNYEKIAKALREWKMAVKKPPTSGEAITMQEWKDYERKKIYDVLMEEFAKMGITSDFVDDYELCQVRKFNGFIVDDSWYGESERHSEAAKKGKRDVNKDISDLVKQRSQIKKEHEKLVHPNEEAMKTSIMELQKKESEIDKKIDSLIKERDEAIESKLGEMSSKEFVLERVRRIKEKQIKDIQIELRSLKKQNRIKEIEAKLQELKQVIIKKKSDFIKASELSLEECIKSRLAKIKKEHPDLSSEEQLKLAKQRCSSRQDFLTDDYTLSGTITRGGEFIYPEGVRIKDFKQLKELFPKFTHLPAFDVHKENQIIGYGHNFKIIEPNEEYPDGNIEADIEIFADIKNDNITTDLKNIPVSIRMYDDSDEIPNTYQNITDLYHIAVSLDKTDIDRCSFGGGKSCRVSLQESKVSDDSIPIGKDTELGLKPNITQTKFKEDFKTMANDKEDSTPDSKDAKTGKDVSTTGAQNDKDLFIKSCIDGGLSKSDCEAAWKSKDTKKTGSEVKPEKKEAPDVHKFDFSDPEIKAQIMNIPEFKTLFEQTKITSDFVKEKIVEAQKQIDEETVKMKAELTKKLSKEKCDFIENATYEELKAIDKFQELIPEKTDDSDIPSETEMFKVLPKQDFINQMDAQKQDRLKSKWGWVSPIDS